MTSPIYWHPFIYTLVMRLIYGLHYEDRYKAIADLIPDHITLFEVCSGDCRIYTQYLCKMDIQYSCGDINKNFIFYAQKKGIDCQHLDLNEGVVPSADIILMQASLYQFNPNQKKIVDKLLASARKWLILAEPVRNLSTSSNPFIAAMAKFNANPGTGHKSYRFNEQTLDYFMKGEYAELIDQEKFISGGREKLFVLKGRGK